MTDIQLTENQRSKLCWLDATDGLLPRDAGVEKNNHALALERRQSLQNLGLLEKEAWNGQTYVYRTTPEGKERAARSRYNQNGGCPACVRAHCVCRVRLVCVAGCGGAGCHGSHD